MRATDKMIFSTAVVLAAAAAPAVAQSAPCTGTIDGIGGPDQYNAEAGTGFVALHNGPDGSAKSVGEVYLGDQIAVMGRRGDWYLIQCVSGSCESPQAGPASPDGWLSGSYLDISGNCP